VSGFEPEISDCVSRYTAAAARSTVTVAENMAALPGLLRRQLCSAGSVPTSSGDSNGHACIFPVSFLEKRTYVQGALMLSVCS
jgi:hypothetical protein